MSDLYAPLRALVSNGNVRHWGGFLLGGGLAFAADGAILLLLTKVWGVSPYWARIPGIAVAMVVSWLVNRRLTFAVAAPPSLAEFGRFAAVSWLSQMVNYAAYAAVLLAWPGVEPIMALFVACFASMIVSYAGFKHGVFKQRDGKA